MNPVKRFPCFPFLHSSSLLKGWKNLYLTTLFKNVLIKPEYTKNCERKRNVHIKFRPSEGFHGPENTFFSKKRRKIHFLSTLLLCRLKIRTFLCRSCIYGVIFRRTLTARKQRIFQPIKIKPKHFSNCRAKNSIKT